MKNEKKVDFTLHYSNGTRPHFYNKGDEPSIISAYGYDYIRENKCMKWEKMGEINGVDIEYCKCPPNEEKELKVGDTVILKSGGPIMTVMCKDDEDEHHFYCGYFYNGEYKEPEFWDNVLKKVEKEYIGCDGYKEDYYDKNILKEAIKFADSKCNEYDYESLKIGFLFGGQFIYDELTK